MNKIAVFIKNYSIGKSSPVLCLLDLLAENYEKVDVFVQDVWCTSASILHDSNVSLVDVSGRRKGVLGFVRKVASFFIESKPAVNDYSNYVCLDPHGLILCHELFPQVRPTYYSLELYFRDNHFNLVYPPEVMKKERLLVNLIKGLIIQSEEREFLFRREYDLSPGIPSFLLPVTYLQPSCAVKSSLVRAKYGISSNVKIALHLGGIQEYHSCIEIALAFSNIADCVLIFHGFYFGEYIKRLRAAISRNNITNVIISEETYDHIEDMDTLLMSCDMGIAWYNDVSPNFTTAGKSSGKISAYLRFGLPVIAKKYPSTLDAVEHAGCGVCVDDFDALPDAVRKIDAHYQSYSDNCRKNYDQVYWFENYREGLIDFIRR